MPSKMKTSDVGIEFIVAQEGEILRGYYDAAGKLTIGVGHLVKPGEPYQHNKPISREESRRLLREDLSFAENAINSLVKVPLTQNQFDALVSFVFNIGESAFKRSSVLRYLNQGDYQSAADRMLLFSKIKSGDGYKVLPGLLKRRKRERLLFLSESKTYPGNDTVSKQTETVEKSGKDSFVQGTATTVEVLEAANTVTGSVVSTLSRSNDLKATVSRSSFVASVVSFLSSIVSFIYGFITDNPEILLIAAVVLVAGLIYLHYSKKRATERFLAGIGVEKGDN